MLLVCSLPLVWLWLRPPPLRAVEEGARGAAAEAYREGRYEEVVSLLAGQNGPELRYLSARAARATGTFRRRERKLPARGSPAHLL